MRTLLGKEYISVKDKLKKQFKTKEPIIEEVVEEVIEDINVIETEERMSVEDKIVDEALKRMGL